jgi:hypothetical protein
MAKHGSDKSPLWKGNRKPHDYTLLYDELFGKWRRKGIKVLECGIYDGASIRGWTEYFETHVIGMDIRLDRVSGVEEYELVLYRCDQTNPSSVRDCLRYHPPFKIIIDDGLHKPEGAIPFFTEAFPYLAKDGYYVVEDVKPKHLEATVAGMKASHPEARITVHDRRYPGSKYDNILIIAEK